MTQDNGMTYEKPRLTKEEIEALAQKCGAYTLACGTRWIFSEANLLEFVYKIEHHHNL